MGMRKHTRRLAAGASVALATSGLSSCKDGGGVVVDPAPEPLQCGFASSGQTLTATAKKTGDVVDVTVVGTGFVGYMMPAGWQVDSVSNVVGATLGTVRLPRPKSMDTLQVSLTLPSGGTKASFTVNAKLFGWINDVCPVRRTFTVDVTTIGVQVHDAEPALPLAARESARISMLARSGRVVELAAHTAFAGAHHAAWSVSGGELDAAAGSPVRWTLPEEPGIYQAELVVDYGDAGLAIDHLMLEVG